MDTSDSKTNSSPEEKVVTVDSLLTSAQNINEKSESANEELGSVSISSEKDLSHSISCLDDMGIPNSFQESTLFPNPNVVDSLSMLPAQNEYGGISAVDSEHQLAHSSVSDESAFQTESLTPSYSDVLDSDATSGVCGLYNLGNTCFMNAGLQCLFNNRTFIDFFVKNNVEEYCKDILTNEFAAIMKKVWSGQYSILHLSDFKDAIGKSHPQFRDYRQHDCQEFLALLLDTMHEQLNISSKSIFAAKSTDNCVPPSVSTIDFVINNSKEVLLPAEDDACKSSNSSKQPCDCSSSYENAKYNSNSPVPSTYSMKDNISESMSLTQSNLIGTGDLSSIHHSNPSIGNTLENASGSFSNQVCKHDNIPISSEANVEKIKDLEKMADLLINNRNVNKYMNKIEPCEANTITPEYLSSYKLLSNVKKSQDLFPQNFSSENRLEKNELACKLNAARKIPKIEDFVKDSKTLNTNVLISEETNNLLKFGSEKFPNHEHHRLRETVNNLGKMLEFDTKQNSLKRTKVTNLIQEKKDMPESVSKEPAEAPLNVSKRIKIEGKKLVHEDSDVVNYEEQGTIGAEQIRDDYFEESSQSGEVSNLSGQISLLDEEFKAHNEWEKYKAENHSVIVHTFHGQLRSTVICAKCGHISITYEPFMYLPVPLPHALERQIVVTYVQSNHNAVRYLVNVKIHEKVQKMKEALQNLIEDTPQEIVLAEVLKNHISRFLDDNVLVRHVNDMTRTVYAFEVVQHLNLEEAEKEITDMYTEDCTENTHLSSNCSNNFRLWEDSLPTQTVETPALSDFSKIASPMGNSKVNNSNSEVFREQDAQDKYTDAKKVSDISEQCKIIDSNFKERHIEDLPVNCTSQETMDNIETVKWHTCAICLEDKPDFDLLTHPQCQCILCHDCIKLSCLHYGSFKFNCPVCCVSIAPSEDFVPINRLADYKFKISLIPIPLVVCHDLFENQRLKSRNIVGHPGLLKLPNSLSAATLYNCIDKSVPYVDTYSLLLVDGQGQSCSRCLYTKHCSGCEVARIGEVNLQLGDSLAIRYLELSEEDLEQATSVIDHKSMQGKRHKSILTLHDCLEAFRERESLDENSPWYCPVCCQNQQAVKSLCVCKFPDILIVYLKRFVFYEYASIKLDSKVCFPLEGLNLSHYVSGPCSDELVYDLQACVCHIGSISSGHYTAYAKHALSNEWFHFNDEIVSKQTPKTEDCVNEYILFYQKRCGGRKIYRLRAIKMVKLFEMIKLVESLEAAKNKISFNSRKN